MSLTSAAAGATAREAESPPVAAPGRRPAGTRRRIAIALGAAGCWIVAVLVIAGVLSSYWLYVGVLVAGYAIAGAGYDLLLGYGGRVSLGNSAFMAVGAYGVGLGTVRWNWPLPVAWLITLAVCIVATAILGAVLVRLEGFYFAVVTLALGLVVVELLTVFPAVTGGTSGFAGIPTLTLGFMQLNSDQGAFTLLWLVAGLLVITGRAVLHGRIGRVLDTSRHDETLAEAMGINTGRTRIVVFVVSAVAACIAGGLMAQYQQYAAPGDFGVNLSIALLLAVLVGGERTLWGSLIGAFVVVMLPITLGDLHEQRLIAQGILLYLLLTGFRGGVAGLLRTGWRLGRRA